MNLILKNKIQKILFYKKIKKFSVLLINNEIFRNYKLNNQKKLKI